MPAKSAFNASLLGSNPLRLTLFMWTDPKGQALAAAWRRFRPLARVPV